MTFRASRHYYAYVGSAVLLPLLLWYRSPAFALLTAMGIALITNVYPLPVGTNTGKWALQAAIVLLGFKLPAGEMIALSGDYGLLVGGYVVCTLLAGLFLGRLLHCDSTGTQLVASGTAICGGTAIATLSPVLRATPEQTGVALALVFLLNALALFALPGIGGYLQMTQEQFGVWVAMAVHDTSSVVATAAIYGPEAAEVATTLKLGRTLWLIPLLLVFSVLQGAREARLRIPGFVVLFVLASLLGSVVPMPESLREGATQLSRWLLVFALFCIGGEISRATLKALRGRMLLLGVALWSLVLPVTYLLVISVA